MKGGECGAIVVVSGDSYGCGRNYHKIIVEKKEQNRKTRAKKEEKTTASFNISDLNQH